MDVEFTKLLTDFMLLMKDWNAKVIPSEEEFIKSLKEVITKISENIDKQPATNE